MIINPGMLIFALFDSGIAFLLVFFVTRSKFGGNESVLARTLGAVFGTIIFIAYFAGIIWFNTEPHTISEAGKMVIYASPIVLSILMAVLTFLSQPPKTEEETQEDETGENNEVPEEH